MPEAIPLPGSTAALAEKVPLTSRHPGLQLDKFIRPAEKQEQQKEALDKVCQTNGDSTLLQEVLERKKQWLESLGVQVSRFVTTGPLTLHLARASALENAGICLHPLYGFVYLPGSGLKGMARSFAETIWLPSQDDQDQAWRKIEDVFGWAPNVDRQKLIKKQDHPAAPRYHVDDDQTSPELTASVGAVVFHDAWPEKWPRLVLDIANTHHRDYYDEKQNSPPGDWETPNMVSFLAIGEGETFSFAISRRRPDVDESLVTLAQQWLAGALTTLGAGAKTAAGYGCFKPADGQPVSLEDSATLATYEATLELITPAFLAGARQQAEDCALRSATLRSLLRWWWRTMYAGFVDIATLRKLEATVWGDMHAGGAVRITVVPIGTTAPLQFNKRQVAQENRLESPPNNKMTQGLSYHSFGMDDKKAGQRYQRHFVPFGARWSIRLTARASHYPTDQEPQKATVINASTLLAQAKAALWLLCHFGGVGSKARKGFGSFADLPDMTLDDCKREANLYRGACGIHSTFNVTHAESLSLEQMLSPLEIQTLWQDPWFTLDQVGFAAQSFAKKYKHDAKKVALGLPRKIHGPRDDKPLSNQESSTWRPSERLSGPKGDRHASPIFYHVAKGANGKLVVRVTAFPGRYLPNLEKSTSLLSELLAHLKANLDQRAGQRQDRPRLTPESLPAQTGQRSLASPGLPKAGDCVETVLLEEKTNKGGWKAKHTATNLSGPIQNSAAVPPDRNPGDQVTLIVASINPATIAFRWPTDEDEKRILKQRQGRGPHDKRRGGFPRR